MQKDKEITASLNYNEQINANINYREEKSRNREKCAKVVVKLHIK